MSTSLTGLGAVAAGASASSNAPSWAHNLVCQVTCLNGAVGPTSTPTAQLQVSIVGSSGPWYTADTRDFGVAPNGDFYQTFNLANYSGASPLVGAPNALLAIPTPGVLTLANWRITVTSGATTGSTFAAAYN